MKLVYCIGSLSVKGGTEKVFANKANYFADHLGWEIHVLLNQGSEITAYDFSKKIIMHDMNINSFLTKPVIPVLSFKAQIRKLKPVFRKKITTINPDVIIVLQHGIDDYIINKLELNIPVVREFHYAQKATKVDLNNIDNVFDKLRECLRLKRLFKLLNQYDQLVLLTRKDQIEGQYKTKTIVIPNTLEKITHTEKNYRVITKRAISVGSMHNNRKRFDVQIRVWAQVVKKYPDWKLDIFGDGPYRSELQKLITNLNLQGSVRLRGTTDLIYKEYNSSDFFIFTSSAEGLPMVLLEAMSCGLPCVSFDCPEGPFDIIEDNVNGYLVENNNEAQMFEKIEKLINSPELVEQLGREARIHSNNFTPEFIIPKWINFFSGLVRK